MYLLGCFVFFLLNRVRTDISKLRHLRGIVISLAKSVFSTFSLNVYFNFATNLMISGSRPRNNIQIKVTSLDSSNKDQLKFSK